VKILIHVSAAGQSIKGAIALVIVPGGIKKVVDVNVLIQTSSE
jgi:hypothetical protein